MVVVREGLGVSGMGVFGVRDYLGLYFFFYVGDLSLILGGKLFIKFLIIY